MDSAHYRLGTKNFRDLGPVLKSLCTAVSKFLNFSMSVNMKGNDRGEFACSFQEEI